MAAGPAGEGGTGKSGAGREFAPTSQSTSGAIAVSRSWPDLAAPLVTAVVDAVADT